MEEVTAARPPRRHAIDHLARVVADLARVLREEAARRRRGAAVPRAAVDAEVVRAVVAERARSPQPPSRALREPQQLKRALCLAMKPSAAAEERRLPPGGGPAVSGFGVNGSLEAPPSPEKRSAGRSARYRASATAASAAVAEKTDVLLPAVG